MEGEVFVFFMLVLNVFPLGSPSPEVVPPRSSQ
jgi:hypothetical protein